MTESSVTTKELTPDQYGETRAGKMINLTETAEPVVDIWPYVEVLTRKEIVSDYVVANNLVQSVYSNQDNSFHHILLPTADSNIFIVIIVNVLKKQIEGHYPLNLNREYGLS